MILINRVYLRRSIFAVVAISGLATYVKATHGDDNMRTNTKSKPYFERSFTINEKIKFNTRAVERDCTPQEIAAMGDRFQGHKTIAVTAELQYANRRTEVGIISQVTMPPRLVDRTRFEMAAPVVDVLLVDDRLYILAKAGMSTNLHVIKDVSNYVAGGRQFLAVVAADSYGSGINPPKPDDVPVCVGFLRGGKILGVKNHRVAKVELIGGEGQKYLRDIPFREAPAEENKVSGTNGTAGCRFRS